MGMPSAMFVLDMIPRSADAYLYVALAIVAALVMLGWVSRSYGTARARARARALAADVDRGIGLASSVSSNEKKKTKQTAGAGVGGSSASASGYEDIFPPSTRDRLRHVLPQASASVDPAVLRRCQMGWTATDDDDWRQAGADSTTLTPAGISLGEIRALGDFPDYAALSGVPLPQRYDGFVLDRAVHRPYRPFRWEYHQTMALQKLEPNWWLELEQTYAATVQQRLALYEQYPRAILGCLPGAELAAKETMEMALQFYCARYPQFFSLSRGEKGWVFHNAILHKHTVLADHHPLLVLLHHVPEDFALMLRHPRDGKYYLRAGVICSSLGWSLGSKLGRPLADVHGPVPHYRAKMEFSMDRFFAKLPTHKLIQRGAWGFEIDRPLFSAPDGDDSGDGGDGGDKTDADGDTDTHTGTHTGTDTGTGIGASTGSDTATTHRGLGHSRSVEADSAPAETAPKTETAIEIETESSISRARIHLRVDWQTLRRLPLSGGVAFNYKAVFTPLETLRAEPYVPSLIERVLKRASPEIQGYKNVALPHIRTVVLPALEEYRLHQEHVGLIEETWDVATLDEAPFYPGWWARWRDVQGFGEGVG